MSGLCSMAQLAKATACGIKVAASSLGSYSTRGGTSAWAVIWLNVVLLVLAGVEIWLATVWL